MPLQPNIVFILSDQHNPRVAGYEGDAWVRTPNLDRLAQSGIRLTNCYCGSPLCVPSRVAMLSSLLPSRTGVYNNNQSLHSDIPTFVHCLTLAGYDTVLSGRMHFIGPDQRHGYKERLVGDLTAVRLGVRNPSFGPWMPTLGQVREGVERSGPGHSNVIAYDRAVTEATLSWLHSRRSERPFFLTVGLYSPHCSYICPRDLFTRYMDILPPPNRPEGFTETVHPAVRNWFVQRGMLEVDPEAVRRARAAYYGLVELTDSYVGRVMDAVQEIVGLDNTLFIYASDHGDMIGHNGLFWKSNFYEGSVRVPFVGSWPKIIPQGVELSGPASLLDLGPTLIDMCDAPSLPQSDGMSLWGALCDKQSLDENRAIYSMLGDVKGDAPAAMIRKGPWKLIAYHGYEHAQLFHLGDDPDEQNDLGRSDKHRCLRQTLQAELGREWDGTAAAANVAISQRRAELVTAWNRTTPPPPGEELWCGDPSQNYIEPIS